MIDLSDDLQTYAQTVRQLGRPALQHVAAGLDEAAEWAQTMRAELDRLEGVEACLLAHFQREDLDTDTKCLLSSILRHVDGATGGCPHSGGA